MYLVTDSKPKGVKREPCTYVTTQDKENVQIVSSYHGT